MSTHFLRLRSGWTATAQDIKTAVHPVDEARSSELLRPSNIALVADPFGFRSGGVAVAWVCGSRLLLTREASSYTAVKRLDCAPACHPRSANFQQAPARSFDFCTATSTAQLDYRIRGQLATLSCDARRSTCDSTEISKVGAGRQAAVACVRGWKTRGGRGVVAGRSRVCG